ncbi:RNA cap guanine-N2 methyltransferase-domain-containing protein, partial [Tribonema minus]
ARRCNVVVDAFVGCGGNAIQFALASHCVIGIDVDPAKLTAAAANAAAYGVRDRIQLILGDAMRVLPLLRGKVDVVFLSPPWGGPAYARAAEFDLGRMVPAPLNGVDVLRAARAAADNVIYFLPRNCSVVQVGLLAAEGGERLPCELETQFLNGKLKTKTAYFGHALVHNDYDSDHAEAMEDEAPVSDTQLQAPHSSASDAKHNVHGLAGLQLGAGVGPTPEPSDQQRQPAAACGLEQMGGSAAEGAHSSVDHGGTAEERAEHPSVLRENVLYNQWLDSMHGGAVKRAHVEHNGHKRQ